jgi:DNA-binding transcriptional LysR family regulator
MDLNEIFVFVKIVESGSFVGAARLLEMPKSTVSVKLSALERRLGVTLIRRTTRKLHVTDAGRAYYEQCQNALAQLMSAEMQISQAQSHPQGLLKISAPVELGGALLPAVITSFRKKYPAVNLEIILSDQTMDLLAEGIDLAIRAGELKDSTLISKKLGAIYFAPYAAPKYLKDVKSPKRPGELQHLNLLAFSPLGPEEWLLVNAKEKQSMKLHRPMVINDLNLIKALTIAGEGVALLPNFLCYHEVKTGKLVRVLPHWRSQLRPVHFVYPSQKFVSPKIRVFIELATEMLRQHLDVAL